MVLKCQAEQLTHSVFHAALCFPVSPSLYQASSLCFMKSVEAAQEPEDSLQFLQIFIKPTLKQTHRQRKILFTVKKFWSCFYLSMMWLWSILTLCTLRVSVAVLETQNTKGGNIMRQGLGPARQWKTTVFYSWPNSLRLRGCSRRVPVYFCFSHDWCHLFHMKNGTANSVSYLIQAGHLSLLPNWQACCAQLTPVPSLWLDPWIPGSAPEHRDQIKLVGTKTGPVFFVCRNLPSASGSSVLALLPLRNGIPDRGSLGYLTSGSERSLWQTERSSSWWCSVILPKRSGGVGPQDSVLTCHILMSAISYTTLQCLPNPKQAVMLTLLIY